MPEQRLPRVKRELFESVSADATPASTEKWIIKLAIQNPQIVMLVDALGTAGALGAVAMVYHVLDSQAEADQMNEDFQ